MIKDEIKNRFHSRYKIVDSGCWEWTHSSDRDGYGIFHVRPFQKAHRFSFALHKGDIPKGMCVCHSCDNPSCVNPDHLWLGTTKENNRDAMRKGRKTPPFRGITHCKRGHELTDENVRRKNGTRFCIKCTAIRNKYHKAKIKAARGIPRDENGRRIYCFKGHKFTPESTRINKKANKRMCKICAAAKKNSKA